MKTFKFTELTRAAKMRAVKDYIKEEIGEYDDGSKRDKTSYDDAYDILNKDLESYCYDINGKFLFDEDENF